ncbi:MAG: Fmu (Sun) domain protein [Chitinophagia bacterium]|nr:Fmu (Sun) domain protein [Chitinophagia bacterium]
MAEGPMRYLESRLRTAEVLLAHYEGDIPFPQHIKAFFRDNRRFGSRDRREVANLCYGFFRLGHALSTLPLRQRIEAGMLIDTADGSFAALAERHPDFRPEDILPAQGLLSEGLDGPSFLRSHLQQPDLFIRIRPGRMEEVLRSVTSSGIPYREVSETTLALLNGSSLDALGRPDDAYVVQDLSSQRTAEWMPPPEALPARPLVRDVCAGSGGKSLLAWDRYPGARIEASDTRPSIISNLEARFRTAGVKGYRTSVEDITATNMRKKDGGRFDLVIVDAPCTGSGTWSRTPWDLLLFDPASVGHYAALQRRIAAASAPLVRPGGHLLYITCSAFAAENEAVRAFIAAECGLVHVRSGLLQGHGERADTMYAALFTSSGG